MISMTNRSSTPQRLYLMQVANLPPVDIPIPCYLLQTSDGKQILIDSGLPSGSFQPPPGRPAPVMGKNVIEQLGIFGHDGQQWPALEKLPDYNR
jgi:N-acyl homoserine lactone hydrolase